MKRRIKKMYRKLNKSTREDIECLLGGAGVFGSLYCLYIICCALG